MKQLVHSILCVFAIMLMVAWKEAPQKISYEGKLYRCEYEVVNGMYHGSYASWYPDGRKRAEGSFRNNMRYGTWTVYDSTGRKRIVRNYKNNFEFELIFPKPSEEGPIPLLREPKWKPVHDSSGRVPYFYLEERAVVVSKRIWRYLPADDKHPLFANDNFYHALIDSVIAGKIKGYEGATDDEFRKEISPETRARLVDTSKYEVIGYRLKEDWFFDKDRMISETRVLGIMPVCRLKNTSTDSFALAWFYYPSIRPLLATQKVSSGNVPTYVQTLDDVFFFRYFHAPVYKESNYYDRTLRENLDNALGLSMMLEQRRIEMSLIEMEHDVWISYSR